MPSPGRRQSSGAGRLAEPLLKGLRRKARNACAAAEFRRRLCDVAQERKLRGQIDQAGRIRREARPQVDVAKSVGAARAHAVFVIMREKFGFVGGDVDADGAIALAAFAGEAEIERLL